MLLTLLRTLLQFSGRSVRQHTVWIKLPLGVHNHLPFVDWLDMPKSNEDNIAEWVFSRSVKRARKERNKNLKLWCLLAIKHIARAPVGKHEKWRSRAPSDNNKSLKLKFRFSRQKRFRGTLCKDSTARENDLQVNHGRRQNSSLHSLRHSASPTENSMSWRRLR